jgi:hypothetical protein
MRLQGTNFQSLTGFDLDVSGLTVIVGPSNKGKSAVFRALRGLFRNELPSEYIRTNSEGLELIATMDGKTVIARRTTKGSTKYVIDGKEFAKLAKTVPPELKAFGMNEVEIGEFTIDPIFSRQNGTQFLIDPEGYSPIELNTILGAFASTEKLEAGKKTANLEIAHKNSEAKTLAGEVTQAETRKAQLELIDKDAQRIAQELQRLKPEVEMLESKEQWLLAISEWQAALLPIRETLSKLIMPDMGEVMRLSEAQAHAVQATNSFRIARFCKRVQDSVEAISAGWVVVERLAIKVQSLNELVSLRAHYQKRDVQPLTAILARIDVGFLGAKALADGIILLGQCATYIDRVVALKTQLEKVDAELAENANQQQQIRNQLQEDQEKIRRQMQEEQKVVCPECGARFIPDEVTNAGPA